MQTMQSQLTRAEKELEALRQVWVRHRSRACLRGPWAKVLHGPQCERAVSGPPPNPAIPPPAARGSARPTPLHPTALAKGNVPSVTLERRGALTNDTGAAQRPATGAPSQRTPENGMRSGR